MISERDRLFLNTLEELDKKIGDDATDYDIITSSGLVRKLVLDGGASLVRQVNRSRRLRLWYAYIEIAPAGSHPVLDEHMLASSLEDGVDPWSVIGAPLLADMQMKGGSLDEFLAATVAIHGGALISAKDVLQHAAYVLGGHHAGDARSEPAQLIERFRKQFIVMDAPAGMRTVRAISRVVARGVRPLEDAIRDECGLPRRPPLPAPDDE